MPRPTLEELRDRAVAYSKEEAHGKRTGAGRANDGRRHYMTMIRKFGIYLEGVTCGACEHCVRGGSANTSTNYKCLISPIGNTSSEASDWRKKWAACGKFERGE